MAFPSKKKKKCVAVRKAEGRWVYAVVERKAAACNEICYVKKKEQSTTWYSVHEIGNMTKEKALGLWDNAWCTHRNYHGSNFFWVLLLSLHGFLSEGWQIGDVRIRLAAAWSAS